MKHTTLSANFKKGRGVVNANSKHYTVIIKMTKKAIM